MSKFNYSIETSIGSGEGSIIANNREEAKTMLLKQYGGSINTTDPEDEENTIKQKIEIKKISLQQLEE